MEKISSSVLGRGPKRPETRNEAQSDTRLNLDKCGVGIEISDFRLGQEIRSDP